MVNWLKRGSSYTYGFNKAPTKVIVAVAVIMAFANKCAAVAVGRQDTSADVVYSNYDNGTEGMDNIFIKDVGGTIVDVGNLLVSYGMEYTDDFNYLYVGDDDLEAMFNQQISMEKRSDKPLEDVIAMLVYRTTEPTPQDVVEVSKALELTSSGAETGGNLAVDSKASVGNHANGKRWFNLSYWVRYTGNSISQAYADNLFNKLIKKRANQFAKSPRSICDQACLSWSTVVTWNWGEGSDAVRDYIWDVGRYGKFSGIDRGAIVNGVNTAICVSNRPNGCTK